MWDESLGIKCNYILHTETTKFQEILIFNAPSLGNVLVLDGIVQCAERDERAYSEVLSNVPMNVHLHPRRVLIIGGGDGGVLRDVLRHSCVEEVVLVDIDEAVIRLSKKYLRGMAYEFTHPKAEIIVGDGLEYLKQNKQTFDVIIADSNDPDGPATCLYEDSFFRLVEESLTADGVFASLPAAMPPSSTNGISTATPATNGASTHKTCFIPTDLFFPPVEPDSRENLDKAFISSYAAWRKIFPVVEFFYSSVPSYGYGQQGFMVCSKTPEHNVSDPVRSMSRSEEDETWQYYNAETHRAMFALPNRARRMVASAKKLLVQP